MAVTKKSSSALIQTDYVNMRGLMCPGCQSKDTTRGDFEIEAGIGHRDVSCRACGSSWVEQFQVVGFANFRAGERKKKRRS